MIRCVISHHIQIFNHRFDFKPRYSIYKLNRRSLFQVLLIFILHKPFEVFSCFGLRCQKATSCNNFANSALCSYVGRDLAKLCRIKGHIRFSFLGFTSVSLTWHAVEIKITLHFGFIFLGCAGVFVGHPFDTVKVIRIY